MSSEVKIRNGDFMESQSESETLQARIREIEDENQELRTQNLIQNRTIIELRNDLMLMRIQMNELADTSQLLRERVRNLAQNAQPQRNHENESTSGPLTAPPLMPPPPPPPPLPTTRIRISPRQVGAGEALTTPLGVSLSSPPRHRIKRDCRQGFYKSTRTPYRRADGTEPGPSTQTPYFSSERPNYFVGLKIIPQFHSFVCSPDQESSCNDSDSSGSDENLQLTNNVKSGPLNGEFKKLSRDFEILKNVRNLHHQRVRQSILQSYNLSLPNTNSRFLIPFSWSRKNRENSAFPSTSRNEVRYFQGSNPGTSGGVQGSNNGLRTGSKVSDCVQYTFPTIHEGLHHSGLSVMGGAGQPCRLRKFKKNIPYSPPAGGILEIKNEEGRVDHANFIAGARKKSEKHYNADSESLSSIDDTKCGGFSMRELSSDFDQDDFQADESSNCLTSTDNSLEKICISESNVGKKN